MSRSRLLRRTVLVVGEALIDVVTDPNGVVHRVPGGSPANVALGLRRLDVPAQLLTCIAPDDDGMAIIRHLLDADVGILASSFGAARTPTAEAAIGIDGQPEYRFDVAWSLPASDTIELPDAVHFGSYSAFMQPGAARVLELARRARAEQRLVTFDPNIREDLIGKRAAARERFEQLAALAHVAKLSDQDAHWLYPGASPADVLDKLIGLGPQIAAITLGADGSIVASKSIRLRVQAPATEVVDAIGAGDSYMAALIQSALHSDLRHLGKKQLYWIAQRSTAAAAITVGRRGADLPWSADLVVA